MQHEKTLMKAAMISCIQRRHERQITLPQLQQHGIDPVIIESRCNPAGGPLNRLAAYQAMQTLENGGLFLEDDIDINPDTFTQSVAMAAATNEVTTLFVPHRAAIHPTFVLTAMTTGIPIPLQVGQLINSNDRRGYYGTQAIYLPGWFVTQALRDRDSFMMNNGLPLEEVDGFDFYIKQTATTILGVFPNPVQHRNPPKMKAVTRGNTRTNPGPHHTSLTYGWRTA